MTLAGAYPPPHPDLVEGLSESFGGPFRVAVPQQPDGPDAASARTSSAARGDESGARSRGRGHSRHPARHVARTWSPSGDAGSWEHAGVTPQGIAALPAEPAPPTQATASECDVTAGWAGLEWCTGAAAAGGLEGAEWRSRMQARIGGVPTLRGRKQQ